MAAIEKEKALLREEILNTKKCQVEFFILSVSVFGLLMRYITMSYKDSDPNSFKPMYLVPLSILLPMWLVFIYKAITISRMVGYYMVLEDVLYNKLAINFIGWENTMAKYRADYTFFWGNHIYKHFEKWVKLIKTNQIKGIRYILFTIIDVLGYVFPVNPINYWEVINGVYLWLSVMCLALSIGIRNIPNLVDELRSLSLGWNRNIELLIGSSLFCVGSLDALSLVARLF